VSANNTRIYVLAPWADTLGRRWNQAVYPPDAATVPTTTTITDPYITDLLTNVTTSGATNSNAARWTSFCVEVTARGELQTMGQTLALLRWRQSGVPLVSSGAAPEFFSTWNSCIEHPEYEEYAAAHFVGTNCVTTGMLDRDALTFTKLQNGGTDWTAIYGDTTPEIDLGAYMPWAPILLIVNNSSSTNAFPVNLTFRGVIQVVPANNRFLARMAKPLPVGNADAESKWWKAQHALLRLRPHPVPGVIPGISRTADPYLGIPATAQRTVFSF
jgi:hypothetical protein